MNPMNRKEARAAIDQIKAGLENVRQMLVEFHQRQGWKALGYANCKECLFAEFQHGKSWFYRQLAAAEVEHILELPIGTLSENQARELRLYARDTEEEEESSEPSPDDSPSKKLFMALSPAQQEALIKQERERYKQKEDRQAAQAAKKEREQAEAEAIGLLPEDMERIRQAIRKLKSPLQTLQRVGPEVDTEIADLESIIERLCLKVNWEVPARKAA